MRRVRPNRRLLHLGCRVLVTVIAGMFSGCRNGTSDTNPVIVTPADRAFLRILSPESGEIQVLGNTLHIRAIAERNDLGTINAVDVFLSPDGGETWGAITDHPVAPAVRDSFGYDWKIPLFFPANGRTFSLAGNPECVVRLRQHDTDDSLKISHSGRFTIEDTVDIRITYPLGGESFEVGDTLAITWTAKDDFSDPIDAVDLQLSPDSGNTWLALLSHSITPDDRHWGRFPWIVPDTVAYLGKKYGIAGGTGICLRIEQYSTADPKRRFKSGMISISRP